VSVQILIGDMRLRLAELPDNSVDSVVCDPPYHLTSIVKRFGQANSAPVKLKKIPGQSGSPYARAAKGFMGQTWDGGDVAFQPETWAEVLRVLKPGGHLVAFSGTRTYHRMAVAIEDAGFEVRDMIAWHYASGFPKSHDISKAIDRAAGVEREIVGPSPFAARKPNGSAGVNSIGLNATPGHDLTAPATDAAREWEGWGTALKPATEPICLARKPLSEKSIAANCLKWGTGALNIDACRVSSVTGQLPSEDAEWEEEQSLCGLCAEVAESLARSGIPATKASIAINNAAPTSSEKAETLLDAINKTDIGCSAGTTADSSVISSNIAEFGKIRTDQSPQGSTSTTSTTTEATTGSKTCLSCGTSITLPTTGPNTTRAKSGSQQVGKRPGGFGNVGAPKGSSKPNGITPPEGRWPANLLHDGSDEVVAGFPETTSGALTAAQQINGGFKGAKNCYGTAERGGEGEYEANSGSAARFFYCAKSSTEERGEGNNHPTVKPVDLMRWLVRLVTPKGGTVLDPFMGSGSTLIAADAEQFHAIGCELSPEYAAIAERRIRDAAGMFADVRIAA
jgi:DNA modification methylase